MKQKKFDLFKTVLMFIVSSVNASNNQGLGMRFDEFIKNIEERMFKNSSFNNEIISEKYRLCCTKERSMNLHEFFGLYQEEHGELDQEKAVIMITISSNEDSSHNTEMVRKQLILAILRYIDRGEKHTFFGDMNINIQCIPISSIGNYSMVNRDVENIKIVLNVLNDKVADSADKIINALCKQRMFEKIQKCLLNLIDNPLKEEYQDDSIIPKINAGRNGIFDSDRIDYSDLKYPNKPWVIFGEEKIYEKICNELFEFETSSEFDYLTRRPEQIFDLFIYLLSVQHADAFDQHWRKILYMLLSDKSPEANRKAFSNFINSMYKEILQNLKANPENNGSLSKKEYIENLKHEKTFLGKFEEYFASLNIENAIQTLKEKDQVANGMHFQKFANENTTKIIFGGHLDYKSIYSFFFALKKAGIAEEFNKFSYIFLDYQNIKEWDEYVGNLKKDEKLMINTVYDLESKITSSDAIGDVSVCNGSDLPSHGIDVEDNYKDSTKPCIKESNTICETYVRIHGYENIEPDVEVRDLITNLERMCLDTKNNEILTKKMITVAYGNGAGYIWVFIQSNKITKQQKLSLLYSVRTAGEKEDEFGKKWPVRLIKCFDNVFERHLDSLKHYLHSLMLSSCNTLEIPNTIRLNETEYTYEERLVSVDSCQDVTSIMRSTIENFYPLDNKQTLETSISIEGILQYKYNAYFGRDQKNASVIRILGIVDTELFTILRRFALNVFNTEIDSSTFTAFDYRKKDLLRLFVTYPKSKMVLHICELQNTGYGRYLSTIIPQLLTKCLEKKEQIFVPEDCKDILGINFPNAELVAIVVSDFGKFAEYNFRNCESQAIAINRSKYMKEVVDRLISQIYNNLDTQDKANNKKHNIATDKTSMSECKRKIEHCIVEMSNMVFEEFEKLIEKQVVKITSVLINHSEHRDLRESGGESKKDKFERHYENMEIFGNEN